MSDPQPAADAAAVALVEAFRSAQNAGDVAGCLAFLHPEAVVDIGSGRFEGTRRITGLLRLLARIHYTTEGAPPVAGEGGVLGTVWTVRHDDLRRNGLGELEVEARIVVDGGRITLLHTRATPATMDRLRAASGGGAGGYEEPESRDREP